MSEIGTNLVERINAEHEQAEAKAQQAIGHAFEAGRLLNEAKVGVEHGGWSDWLAVNFRGSKRTAQAYMRLFSNREALEAKTQSSAHLSIDGALKLLAAEPQEENARDWRSAELMPLHEITDKSLSDASKMLDAFSAAKQAGASQATQVELAEDCTHKLGVHLRGLHWIYVREHEIRGAEPPQPFWDFLNASGGDDNG